MDITDLGLSMARLKRSNVISIAELARFLNVQYNAVYRMTFDVDFPKTMIDGKYKRNDVYKWCVVRAFKTWDQIDAKIADDHNVSVKTVQARREYDRVQQRLHRERKAAAE